MSDTTYVVKRFYAKGDGRNYETIKMGLTLDEAQAHCNDPETSSTTCTTAEGRERTERHGAWFDGYDAEPGR